MRKLIIASLLALSVFVPSPGRAYETPTASGEVTVLNVPLQGAVSTRLTAPFVVQSAHVSAPDGLVARAEADGSGVRLSVKDISGLDGPRALRVLAVGGAGRARMFPVLLTPMPVVSDDFDAADALAPTGASASPGFTPIAHALSLPLNATAVVTFALAIPPGPVSLFTTSSPNYNVAITPATFTSAGNPVVVTATVTALGGTSHLIQISALGAQAHHGYVILNVMNSPYGLALSPAPLSLGILTTRTMNVILGNPAAFARTVNMVWSYNPAWMVSGTVTQVALPALTVVTLPITITRVPSLGNSMTMVVYALSDDGDLRTSSYTFEVKSAYLPRASWPGLDVVDSYEPDNTCAQHSTISFGASNQQSRTHHGPTQDVDVVKYVLPPNATHVVQVRGLGYNAEPILRAYYDTCTTSFTGGYGVITSTNNLTSALMLPNPYGVSRDIWLVIKNNKPSGPGSNYVLRVVP